MNENSCKNDKCTPCEEMFEANIDRMVGEVENHSSKQHHDKEKEVNSAFGTPSKGGACDTKHGQHSDPKKETAQSGTQGSCGCGAKTARQGTAGTAKQGAPTDWNKSEPWKERH